MEEMKEGTWDDPGGKERRNLEIILEKLREGIWALPWRKTKKECGDHPGKNKGRN